MAIKKAASAAETGGITLKYEASSMVMMSSTWDAFEIKMGIEGDGQQNKAPSVKDPRHAVYKIKLMRQNYGKKKEKTETHLQR